MTKTITINEKEMLERLLKNLDPTYTLTYASYDSEIPASVIQECIDEKSLDPLYEKDYWGDARHYSIQDTIKRELSSLGYTKEEIELFLATSEADRARDEILNRDDSDPEMDCLRQGRHVYAYLRFHSNYDCWCGLYEYGNKLQIQGTALTAVLAALSLNPWKVKQAANRAGLDTIGPFRNIQSRNDKEVVDYDDFIKDLVECPNYGNWSFFGRLDMNLMNLNDFDVKGLTIPAGTDCGMYNWWNGGGSLHFCKTIRPVKVKDIIKTLGTYKDDIKLVVDDKSNKEYEYVPTDVYGAYYINKENLFVE